MMGSIARLQNAGWTVALSVSSCVCRQMNLKVLSAHPVNMGPLISVISQQSGKNKTYTLKVKVGYLMSKVEPLKAGLLVSAAVDMV